MRRLVEPMGFATPELSSFIRHGTLVAHLLTPRRPEDLDPAVNTLVNARLVRYPYELDFHGAKMRFWFEVTEVRGHIHDGRVGHYQVNMKVGFRMDAEG